jgi:1,2-diacylglycerol 3-beta-glucosyltransferase
MSAITRLPQLWRSTTVNEVAILEVTSYLLVPWLIVLPWSILQQWIIFQLIIGSGHGVIATELGGLSWQATYALLWYALSFAPNLLIGFIYSRRTQAVSLGRALVLGHLMIAWNYIGYLAAWRALTRMVCHRTDWTKTSRSPEAVARPTPRPGEPAGQRRKPRKLDVGASVEHRESTFCRGLRHTRGNSARSQPSGSTQRKMR